MPIVCDRYDLLFTHLPQTGGKFVEHILLTRLGGRKIAPRHATFRATETRRPSSFRVFTVCEPVSWYRSYWAFSRSRMSHPDAWPVWEGGDDRHPTKRLDQSCGARTFATFVRNALTEFPNGFLRSTYCDFLNGSTHALRRERLEHDVELLLTAVGYQDPTFVRSLTFSDRLPPRWTDQAVLPEELEHELRQIENLADLEIPYVSQP